MTRTTRRGTFDPALATPPPSSVPRSTTRSKRMRASGASADPRRRPRRRRADSRRYAAAVHAASHRVWRGLTARRQPRLRLLRFLVELGQVQVLELLQVFGRQRPTAERRLLAGIRRL